MRIDKAYCPNCGAPVAFQEGRDDTFCQHCGTQVFKTDEQLEIKLEYQDRREERDTNVLLEHSKDRTRTMIFTMVFLLLAFLLMALFGK